MDELRIGFSWADVTPPGAPVAPFIITQPTNAVVNVGGNTNFTVAAGGTLPFSYQWYFNTNTLLVGATNATLNITNAQLTNAGRYHVVITNLYGAVTSSVATLTVTNPVALGVICPTNITISANSGCFATNISLSGPIVTQSCTGLTITSNAPASFPVGTNNYVTWTITDSCGNSNNCNQQVIVRDTNAPVITCPANIATTNSAGTNVALNVVLGTPVTSDNCGVASLSSNAPSKYPFGTNTVMWTVVDNNGNTNTCQQLVIVTSNAPPILSCPTDITGYVSTASCVVTGLNLGTPAVTFTGCGGVVLSSNGAAAYPPGTNTVVWTATDQCGRAVTCQQRVIIRDTNAPVINCSANLVVTNDPGQCSKSNVTFSVTATDNCTNAVVVVSSKASGSTFPLGVTSVTNTATDPSGNNAACTFTVTVLDKQPPSIVCPATLVTTNNPGTNVAMGVVLGTPAVTELCGGFTLTSNAPSYYPTGTTIVTWIATDNAGNVTNCQQQVIVTNILPPTLTCPADVTVSAGTNCLATGVSLGTPVVTYSGCGGAIISSNAPTSYGLGTNLVTWTVTDQCGLSSSCQQKVIIRDTTPPGVTTNQGADVTIECPTAPSFSAPTFVDVCNGTITPSVLTATNTLGCSNIFTRIWTATDASGNSTNRSQVITVRDTTAPAMTVAQGADSIIECPAVPSFSAPTFVDACAGTIAPTVVTVTNAVGSSNLVTRTWTANDGCGNTTNRSQTITVRDTTPPVFTCSTNIMVDAPAGQCASNVSFMVTASDACSGSVPVASVPTNRFAFPVGVTTVTNTAVDTSGNTSTCTFTVTVLDKQPPSITCPADLMLSNTLNLCYATNVVLSPVMVTDNCSSPVTVTSNAPAFFPFGTNFVTWTATDASGNSTSCVQRVIVRDGQPPNLGCPGILEYTTDPGQCTHSNLTYSLHYSDLCSSVTVTQSLGLPPGGTFPKGTTTNRFIVTDANGNSSTCTFYVIVYDEESPGIACPGPLIVSVNTNSCQATNVVLSAPAVSDNCGPVFVTSNVPAVFFIGTNLVTWLATDTSGNTNSCVQQVIVRDTQAPVINCPGNLVYTNDPGTCVKSNVTFAVSATDNCGYLISQAAGLPSGSNFPVGVMTNRFVATDPSGNSNVCSFTVTVLDKQLPTISCPGNLVYTNDFGSCVKSNVTFSVTGADNCGYVISLVTGLPTGSNFPVGVTPNRFVVADPSGNTNFCAFTVTVLDKQPPTVICPPDIATTNNPGTNVASNVALGQPVVSDNCGVALVTSNAPAYFPLGTNVVTWTAMDSSGNPSTCQQRVVVSASLPPSLSCPADVIVSANAACVATNVTLGTPTVSYPGCGRVVVKSNAPSSYPLGTNLVTWTATDQCGLVATCQQRVIVQDTTAPAVTADQGGNSTIECPATPVFTAPTIQDNCGGAVVPTFVTTTNLVGCLRIYTRTWTATDSSGNKTNRSQVITVQDNTPPAVTAAQGTNMTIECSATPTFSAPVFTDLCAGLITPIVVTITNAVGCLNIITRTWTANDGCGNTTNRSQIITVRDTTAPAVTSSQGADVMIECPAVPTFTAPIFTDACAGVITPAVVTETNSVGCSNVFTRTWTASDGCGNTTNRSQTITVRDTTAPAVTSPQGVDVTIECPAVPTFTAPIFTDACAGVITPAVVTETNSVGCSNVFTRTWTASDGCGNVTNRTQVITVRDTTAPAVTVNQGANVTIECPATPNFGAPTFVDVCGVVTTTVLTVTNNVGCSNVFTRTWTASDGCGNVTNRTQVITVRDTTPPAVTVNQGVNVTIECPATPSFSAPTFADICDGITIMPTVMTTTNAVGNSEVLTRTWMAADSCGNATNRSQVITVRDTTPPVITCLGNIRINAAAGQCTNNLNFTVTATDACDGPVPVVSVPPNRSAFPVGVTVVTNTAVDSRGNTTNCTFTVTVLDITPPVIVCPSNITVNAATGQCSSSVAFAVTATDSCTNVSSLTSSVPTNGFAFPVGVTTVTNIARDANGNSSIRTFTVTVVDNQTPNITCGGNIITTNTPGTCGAVVNFINPLGTDNCPGAVTTQIAGLASGATFPIGSTTNTFKVSDASGNTNTCSFTVTVVDAEPPTISCPPTLFTLPDVGTNVATGMYLGVPVFGDNCNGASVTNNAPAWFSIGTNFVRWTAHDMAGLSNSCLQQVVVGSTNPPTMSCPAPLLLAAAPDLCRATNVSLVAPTTTSSCGTVTLTSNAPSLFTVGTNLVVWLATDQCGNTNSCVQTIVVVDTQPPVLICPTNLSLDTLPGARSVTNADLGLPAVTDNCGSFSITNDAPAVLPVGTNTVVWMATDGSGNTANCQQQVVVVLTCSGILDVSSPDSLTLCAGSPALFEVIATSPEPVSYTWQLNDQDIPGQTNQSFLISQVSATNAGTYAVVAQTACAAVTNTAVLTVLPLPDESPASFSSGAGITIRSFGTADPYGSVILPQCVPGLVKNLTVNLYAFSHFFPSDVSILLVSPDGRAVRLMAGAGGSDTISPGIDLSFSDASTKVPPTSALIPFETYHPSDYLPDVQLPDPAPSVQFSTNLSTFIGVDPNGPWQLYVYDSEAGAGGSIAGWSLTFNWRDSSIYLRNPVIISNAGFRAEIWGQVGATTVVERSADLSTWTPMQTNIFSTNPGVYLDLQLPLLPHRFYRAVQP